MNNRPGISANDMVQIAVTAVFAPIASVYLAGVIVMLLNHDHHLHRVWFPGLEGPGAIHLSSSILTALTNGKIAVGAAALSG